MVSHVRRRLTQVSAVPELPHQRESHGPGSSDERESDERESDERESAEEESYAEPRPAFQQV